MNTYHIVFECQDGAQYFVARRANSLQDAIQPPPVDGAKYKRHVEWVNGKKRSFSKN